MKIKVSVLMPVYNQERFLKESIDSILKQNFKDLELLVMDDGSKDNSLKIIKEFKDKRIRVFKNKKRQGLAKCLNSLIRKSKAEYLARMDGDDISFKDRLKKQVEFLDKNKSVALVGCWVKIIDDKEKIVGEFKYPEEYKEIRRDILGYNPFIHPSVMMRKDVIKKIGGYDKNLFYSQDYDLFLRLAAQYSCHNLNEFLLKFRWFPSFKKQKEQHRLALKIRLRAIKEYDYSLWEVVKLIKPFLFYLVPLKIKRLYWQKKFN